jgi:hypothetical protein
MTASMAWKHLGINAQIFTQTTGNVMSNAWDIDFKPKHPWHFSLQFYNAWVVE